MGEVRLENGKRNHRQPETAAHAAPAKKRRRSPWLSALQIAKHGPDRYAEARKRSSSEESRIKWTRLSCRTFAADAVRLQLHALAYNLGNFLRTLATPEPIRDWSMTNLKEKPIKIGAKVVSHGRYIAFQMAEVAIPRGLFADILRLIVELRAPPDLAPA